MYYQLTAQLRARTGDLAGAQTLYKKMEQMQRSVLVRTDPFGPQPGQARPGKP